MAKTKSSEEKFKCVMIRIPIERAQELDDAAKELGLPLANFACMQVIKTLNARKGIIPAGEQAVTAN